MYTKHHWSQHWQSKNVPWSNPKADLELKKHWKALTRLGIRPGASVLVPLCGNSKALAFLNSKKLKVSGIEFVPEAVRELLAKRLPRQKFKKKSTKHGIVFYSPSVSIYQMDFFKFKKPNEFDFIYDRAALIAISPKKRAAYAKIVQSSLKPGGIIFIDTFKFKGRKIPGPPFEISKSELRKLFARCSIVSAKDKQVVRIVPPHLGGGKLTANHTYTIFKKRE